MHFSDNALEILRKRYLLKNDEGVVLETPEQMFRRVAKALAFNEVDSLVWEKNFYKVLSHFEGCPAGRTLANAGTRTRLVSNCVVLHIRDTMEDIFQTLKDAALLQKAGSGIGFPLHLMRPAGYKTYETQGTSSGPISFLHVYNTAFGVIKQQNRHGANIAVMRIDHPDILEFISAKSVEGKLTTFNVSLSLTDEFMHAASSNDSSPWMCRWKEEDISPREIRRDGKFLFVDATPQKLTASEILDRIVDGAWKTGEPGILFYDTINRSNPLPRLGPIEACNPCVTGDTLVMTNQGLRYVRDLIGRQFKAVVHGKEYPSTEKGFWSTGIRKIYTVRLSNGMELKATGNHPLSVKQQNGTFEWIEIGKISAGDIVTLSNNTDYEWSKGKGDYVEGYAYGQLIGGMTAKDYAESVFEHGSYRFVVGVLRGLFDSPACTITGISENFVSISLAHNIKELQNAQQLLASIGISSVICSNRRDKICELHIDDSCRSKLASIFGLGVAPTTKSSEKSVTLHMDDIFTSKVESITPCSKEEMSYDCSIPGINCFAAQGILAHNCGEMPLHDGDVCNLGSINLEKFVKNGEIVWDRLRHVVRVMVRMLDNVIDQTEFPVERVNKQFRANRRIGLGIMGFADMLYLLRIGYNTEKGREVARRVMKCIQEESWKASLELGKEKGTFPNMFLSNLSDSYRNSAITTIAPTGTTSLIFDVCGGMEPYWALAYERQMTGSNKKMYYVNKHLASALMEAEVYYDDVVRRICEEGSLQKITSIPESVRRVFVTALDISPMDHIKMQAAFQEYVDCSISKTINCPENATREEIRECFIEAWKLGVKGLTIYRNNSRQVQVLNLSKPKCPECKIDMIAAESCYQCPKCGVSLCSM